METLFIICIIFVLWIWCSLRYMIRRQDRMDLLQAKLSLDGMTFQDPHDMCRYIIYDHMSDTAGGFVYLAEGIHGGRRFAFTAEDFIRNGYTFL